MGDASTDPKAVLANHFRCSSGARYLLVAGAGTAVQDGGSITPEMIGDGPENSLIAVETSARDRPQPDQGELTLADLDGRATHEVALSATAIHRAGSGLIFADGAIYRLLEPLCVGDLRALMTIDGGEPLTRARLENAGRIVRIGDPRR